MSGIAVVGAGGFIGGRTAAMLHESGRFVVLVARRTPDVAVPGLKLADAFDLGALAAAFAGCDAVVSSIAGDSHTITDTVAPLYAAAERAGVRRLIYLSSAAVHGQAPAPGTDEDSPLSLDQPFEYNRAKIDAERRLHELRRNGRVEIVILRPGIVYGPRSQWTAGLADQLLAGEAFLADGGRGICNAIFVDNVVDAIERAVDAESVDGEAFLISDRETATWRDLTAPVADTFGIPVDSLPQPASADILRTSVTERLADLLPRRIARRIRGTPAYSRELALLHSNRVRLPTDKAERMLGFNPPVSFAEGCRRSVEWLRIAGYPVRG
jgi:nucleoside-diphosphate-sugar epimerase